MSEVVEVEQHTVDPEDREDLVVGSRGKVAAAVAAAAAEDSHRNPEAAEDLAVVLDMVVLGTVAEPDCKVG